MGLTWRWHVRFSCDKTEQHKEGDLVSSTARERKTKRAQWLRFTLNRG